MSEQCKYTAIRINITLKPEIDLKMMGDIMVGAQDYGLQSLDYLKYIEELAIKYWTDLDRHELLLIETL